MLSRLWKIMRTTPANAPALLGAGGILQGFITVKPLFACPACGEYGATLYHRNTAYHDDELNWSNACESCQEIEFEQYAEMWREYYAGCL